MPRTISQWAADAIDSVQFACNLSGLVFALERCVSGLSLSGQSIEWIDHHPICILWADKLDDLSRSRGLRPIPTTESLMTMVPKFAVAMREICDDAHRLGLGTDWRNEHPKAQEFVRRLVAVTGCRDLSAVSRAFEECQRLASEPETKRPTAASVQ